MHSTTNLGVLDFTSGSTHHQPREGIWRKGDQEEIIPKSFQRQGSKQEQLNIFYDRFNGTDPVEDWTPTNTSYAAAPISVEEQKVISILSKLHLRKAPGLDRLKGRILKEYEAQQGIVVTQLFQLFLNISFIPRAWKETTIIPAPKKPHAKAMNDFRPVTLTFIFYKFMKRVVDGELTTMVGKSLDLLQFAYM
eukprot:superscaffoldBa00000174_g2414